MASGPFTVEVRQRGDGRVVAPAGELDLATAQELSDALTAGAGSPVVVDLAAPSFVDSSGIGALVRARQQNEERGSSLVLTRPQDRIAKTFEIVGLANWMAPWSPDWE